VVAIVLYSGTVAAPSTGVAANWAAAASGIRKIVKRSSANAT
jgi:enhancing lycopene biosynthesis protein 2